MQIVRPIPKKNPPPPSSSVVATVHTARGLLEARKLGRGDVGFVEIRLDAPGVGGKGLATALGGIRPRILLTARHPSEGGARRLTPAERRGLLSEYLPVADAIDVELRSVPSMGAVLQEAKRRKVTRVISFHDFRGTPNIAALRAVVRRASAAGADIVKIATHLRGPADLAVLLLLQGAARVPLATMGMGPLGKVSRLVLGAAGSRLNYGYLDKPQVSGQWPAAELVLRLKEVMP